MPQAPRGYNTDHYGNETWTQVGSHVRAFGVAIGKPSRYMNGAVNIIQLCNGIRKATHNARE